MLIQCLCDAVRRNRAEAGSKRSVALLNKLKTRH